MAKTSQRISNWWYVLVIVLSLSCGIIGAVISIVLVYYFVYKKDKNKAKKLVIASIIAMIISVIITIINLAYIWTLGMWASTV